LNIKAIVPTLFLSTSVLFAQQLQSNQDISFMLNWARQFQERGDHIFAALLFSSVARSSQDSNEVAEAAYRFLKCGDAIAELLTRRIQFPFGSSSQDNSFWTTKLEPATN
jgi:hypothetical protein